MPVAHTRLACGYGPNESEQPQKIFNFAFQYLEIKPFVI